jgi:hypothetical protein
MTIGGSGVGGNSGNIGGPPNPLPQEMEASAWAQTNRLALGIVPEGSSFILPFQQIIERYQTGYLGGFGYKTAAENPLLGHPLEVQRRAESSTQQQNNSWQTAYQNFIDQLPPELQARFDAESKKPFEQRNLSFVALDNNLQLAAKILTQLESSSKPAPAESLEETRTALNLIFPFASLVGVLKNSQEVVQSAQQLLTQQGANYRYFDSFNNVLSQLQSPISLMSKVYNSLNNTGIGQLSPQAANAAGKAAQQLTAIATQIEKTSLGADLQLLLPTIKSLEMVASAFSLQNSASASLFIALHIASIGLFSSQSSSGILGQGFETVTVNLNQGIIASIMPENNLAGKELLSNFVIASFAILSGITSLSVQSGLGLYPINRDLKDIENAHFFASEIALQLAVSSGLLNSIYKEVISISGGDEQAQEVGSSILVNMAELLIIFTIANNPTKAARLIENMAVNFSQGINSANDLQEEIQKEDQQHEELKKENDKRTILSIAIKLAGLALESQNYEAFLEATNNLLEDLGTSPITLKKDLSTIGTITSSIVGITSRGDPNQQITGIINII